MWDYTVQFEDTEVTELTGNAIAESMYAQCESDRNQYVLLNDIIDFRKTNPALSIKDQKIVVEGRASLRCYNVGRQVCCKWKDGQISWENLSNMKESHPVETAEYAHF